MAAVRRRLIEALWRTHRWVYRATGGRLGGRIVGMPVLVLTTTGRRTGRPRSTNLTYLPYGTRFVVIGSSGGAAADPDWVRNLRTHPSAAVQIRDRYLRVQAREAIGAERRDLWERAVQAYPGYAVYQARTRRTIPVVVLEPVTSGKRSGAG